MCVPITGWGICTRSLIRGLLLNEPCCCFFADACDVADLVLEGDSVELVGALQQLWTEGGRDELGILGKTVDHGYREGDKPWAVATQLCIRWGYTPLCGRGTSHGHGSADR